MTFYRAHANPSYIYDKNNPSHKTYIENVDQPNNTTNPGDKGVNRRHTNNISNDSCPITSKVDSK